MTHSAFFLTQPVCFAALGRVVAAHFAVPAEKALVHDDARDLDPPFEDTPGGRLWREYEACEIKVYVCDMSDVIGPFAAWFDVEMQDRARNDFQDRPLAHAIARDLGQQVVFRDPIPDPRDHPIIEAAQIAAEPDGTETAMWLSEYGDAEGRTRIDLLVRSEL